MQQLINHMVDTVANEAPGVYTVIYESGKQGVEFTEEALQRYTQRVAEQCIRNIKTWRDADGDEKNSNDFDSGYRSGCNDSIVEIQLTFKIENAGN